jgi:nicotinamide mononucleotide transporter
MPDLTHQVVMAWQQTSTIELIAMVLALAYVLLAIPQHVACWYAAFSSSALYVVVFFGAHLYMEAALNVFYAAMAVYGFRQWRSAGTSRDLPVIRWSWRRQLQAFGAIVVVAALSGALLQRYTPAASPYIDSTLTWSSVFATYLVARKVYENWYWWLVIDSASLGLSFTRHLYVTVLLFALYLIFILIGMREWRRSLPSFAPAVQPGSHASG